MATDRGADAVLLRVLDVEVLGDRADVDRGLQSQGTSERLAAHCHLEATRDRVQPRTTSRHPVSWVRAEHHRGGIPGISVRRRDHSQQCRPAIRSATSHTGARWLGTESSPVGHTSVYRVGRAARSTGPAPPQDAPEEVCRPAQDADGIPPRWAKPQARGAAGALPASVSGRMSMRQPVSLAARRAFWPSLPMARLSW